jgi:hypothetical protein
MIDGETAERIVDGGIRPRAGLSSLAAVLAACLVRRAVAIR